MFVMICTKNASILLIVSAFLIVGSLANAQDSKLEKIHSTVTIEDFSDKPHYQMLDAAIDYSKNNFGMGIILLVGQDCGKTIPKRVDTYFREKLFVEDKIQVFYQITDMKKLNLEVLMYIFINGKRIFLDPDAINDPKKQLPYNLVEITNSADDFREILEKENASKMIELMKFWYLF